MCWLAASLYSQVPWLGLMLVAAAWDPVLPLTEAAEVRAEGAEGVRTTGCYRTGLPARGNKVAVAACQHLRSVVDCM